MDKRHRSLVSVQGVSDSSDYQHRLNQAASPERVKGSWNGPARECVIICPELALPYLRVMLSLERQEEDDMSKHHALSMRVSIKREVTASQEPELKRWAQSQRRFLLVS
jgi:hypothetical protein